MTNKNTEKLQIMAQDYLQTRYKYWLGFGKRDEDWIAYDSACDTLAAFGCRWFRHYNGDKTQEQIDDIKYYSHSVIFPDNELCGRLNENAWKD